MDEAENLKPLTLKQAAGIAGVSPDTVARWCRRYGIGKQLHSKAPWRVDPVGLGIVAAGDCFALELYRQTTASNSAFPRTKSMTYQQAPRGRGL